MAQPRDFSEKTAQVIDEEIRSIIRDLDQKAEETLSAHRNLLDLLARELIEREALSKNEIQEIIDLPSERNDENRKKQET